MGSERHIIANDVLDRGLYQDGWFWLALAVGPLVSWTLFLLVGNTAVAGFVWEQWRQLLWLVLLYPMIEEWLFRGVLQRWLLKNRYARQSVFGFTLANGVASLLFVAAHLLTQPIQWALLVIFPSLLFGWFRDRYDSILPGVILHCSYNLSYFFLFSLH